MDGDQVADLQRDLNSRNLVFKVHLPIQGPAWQSFDDQVNSHCKTHSLMLPPNPRGDLLESEPSTLAWQIIAPSQGRPPTYAPLGNLTRFTFDWPHLRSRPYGDKIPNHLVNSAMKFWFICASIYPPTLLTAS
jgi:hypothetical protein